MTRDEVIAAYASGQRRFACANLSDANLSRADLSRATLSRADLSDANLSDANLSDANLSDANLSCANLSGANLSDANLSGAYLSCANLSGANLSDANLSGANLSGAYLSGANLSRATLPAFQLVPEYGAFQAYKALSKGVLAYLTIPADAHRTSSLIGRKCRASHVIVDRIESWSGDMVETGYGLYDGTLYRVGAVVTADEWNDDIRVECTHGIHFFLTRAEAKRYLG